MPIDGRETSEQPVSDPPWRFGCARRERDGEAVVPCCDGNRGGRSARREGNGNATEVSALDDAKTHRRGKLRGQPGRPVCI